MGLCRRVCPACGRTWTLGGSDSNSGVFIRPGATVLMRMPDLASSRAIGSVMPTMAALDAEYAAWPIWPSNAAMLHSEHKKYGYSKENVQPHQRQPGNKLRTLRC